MSESTQFELAANADDAHHLIGAQREIIRLLRRLIHRRALISAFFNAGNDLLLTAVLSVDEPNNRLILDGSGNEVQNQRMADAEKVIFVAYLDKVKVQFVGDEVRRGMFEGRPAFLMPIPQEVLHLQQREYYRLATPIANPLKCRVPLDNRQFGEMVILDIGAGGIGLLIEGTPEFSIEIGAEYPGCSIELPGIASLEVSLRVQSLSEITLRNGRVAHRCGCQFIGLLPVMQATIQHYLVRLERERITSTAGR